MHRAALLTRWAFESFDQTPPQTFFVSSRLEKRPISYKFDVIY